jgi:hypothetical protein
LREPLVLGILEKKKFKEPLGLVKDLVGLTAVI